MGVTIRQATIFDSASILNLIQELADYEKEPESVKLNISDIQRHGFGETPLFRCLVAEFKNEVIGMALYYPRYSTWKGPTFHLEDLIVTKSKRGLGIGFKLFSKFIHYAHELNVKRIEWVVLDWNKSAIDFYKKNGAHILDDWRVAQMDFNAIKKFVNNEDF